MMTQVRFEDDAATLAIFEQVAAGQNAEAAKISEEIATLSRPIAALDEMTKQLDTSYIASYVSA
jgi:hypothetical protein